MELEDSTSGSFALHVDYPGWGLLRLPRTVVVAAGAWRLVRLCLYQRSVLGLMQLRSQVDSDLSKLFPELVDGCLLQRYCFGVVCLY